MRLPYNGDKVATTGGHRPLLKLAAQQRDPTKGDGARLIEARLHLHERVGDSSHDARRTDRRSVPKWR